MKPQMRTILFLVIAGIAPFSSLPGQWSHRIDADLLVTDLDTAASGPAIAADGQGGVFAAWDEARTPATTDQDIFIQYYSSDGVARWTANGVAVCTAVGRQDEPIVVNAGGGSVYVVWYDERDGVINDRIYAQRFDATGAAQWTANGIRVGPNNFAQSDLVALSDGAGNLLVAWSEVNNNFRTYVQKIDSSGSPLWGATGFEFSSGVFDGASDLNITPDGAGGVVIGWIRFGANPRTVYARRILANGTPAFGAVGFGNDVTALGNLVTMAPDGTGGAFIGWQIDNGVNDNLCVQRVDGSGNLVWGDTSLVVVDQPNVQDNFQIVADNSGGAFLVWDDPRTAVDNVYIQHVTSIGSFSLAEDGIPVGVSTAQRFSARVIPDGAGGAIITFRYNQDGAYAQRINSSGTRMWGDDGVQITDNATVNFPVLTTDGFNGAIYGALTFTDGNRPALKRVLASGDLPTSRLVNISTRAFVGTGDSQAILGFVFEGTGTKDLLIRAAGPSLGPLGVNAPLEDPLLTLNDANGSAITSNDDWESAPNLALLQQTTLDVGAFEFPTGGKDAALLSELTPALYTGAASGIGGLQGVALLEVYDADPPSSTARLTNLSSRVFVGLNEEQALPGFVIQGPATMTLLIRAIGPTLADFGVTDPLADPILTVYDIDGVTIQSNDNWGSGGSSTRNALIAAAVQVGAFELEDTASLDAALLITLDPGNYTAGIVGAENGTGPVLIELYIVP